MPIIATREHGYLLIEMNEGGNAFTTDFLEELEIWFDRAATDGGVFAIILCSKAKVFSVGGHLDQMQEGVDAGQPSQYVERIVPHINRIIEKMVSHKLPIITILNGTAAGGGMSLFLAGDIRFATPRGKLYSAFSDLALTPDSGSSILVPYRFANTESFEFLTKASFKSAEQLLELQVVNEVIEEDKVLMHAKELAMSYVNFDKPTLKRTKQFNNRELLRLLQTHLREEYDSIVAACKQPIFTERLAAVRAKLAK